MRFPHGLPIAGVGVFIILYSVVTKSLDLESIILAMIAFSLSPVFYFLGKRVHRLNERNGSQ